MKHLITGITGFAGSHLAEKLVHQDEQVYGLDIPSAKPHKLDHIIDRITLFQGDITDYNSLKKTVRECLPDRIYHLAALSHVKKSFDSKRVTMEVNVFGALNLLESLVELNMRPRVLLVGSSAQYGVMAENDPPIAEDVPLNPMSPYGLSKTCQEFVGKQYFLTNEIPVIMVRCFNYTGIRQDPEFVCSDFARQIAEMEKGIREPVLHVGNIDVWRDFTDVADMMDAFIMALDKCEPGEVYNLCSGNSYSVREILTLLIELSTHTIEYKQMPDRMRPVDIPYLKGDYSKFAECTGWKPRIPFRETLQHILQYWRNIV